MNAVSRDDVEVSIRVRVPADLHTEFTHHYPQYGAITWAVETGMQALVDLAKRNPISTGRVAMLIENRIGLGELPNRENDDEAATIQQSRKVAGA